MEGPGRREVDQAEYSVGAACVAVCQPIHLENAITEPTLLPVLSSNPSFILMLWKVKLTVAGNENAVEEFSRMAVYSTQKDRYSSSILRTFPFRLKKETGSPYSYQNLWTNRV